MGRTGVHTMSDTAKYKYRAFISYSHSDSKVAEWLQRALESYRIPERFVGRETSTGVIESRVGTIFRDRDELSVSADLTGKINEALAAAQFLIVLCSRSSARSRWVNQEVINFKRLRGAESIIAVIVDGEPGAGAASGREADECFVPGLRFQIGADGHLSDIPAEPVAADLRPGKDTKRLVRMKVLAGLLDVGLDELIRRDNQRRQRLMAWGLIASLIGIMAMGALTWNAIAARSDSERRRVEAEEIIEFLLSDMKRPLMEVGKVKEYNKISQRAARYFEGEDLEKLPDESLGRRARGLHLLGETRLQEKNFEEAQRLLERAWQTTGVLIERDPANVLRLFEHGQSEYWLGRLWLDRGDPAAAEPYMLRYREVADKAADLDETNVNRMGDAGRAATSLAAVRIRLLRASDALSELDRALNWWAKIENSLPNDAGVAVERATTIGWRADALRLTGDLTLARAERLKAVQILRDVLTKFPKDKDTEYRLAVAERKLGSIEMEALEIASSVQALHSALQRFEGLTSYDAENQKWREEYDFAKVVARDLNLRVGSAVINVDAAARPSQDDYRNWDTLTPLRRQMLLRETLRSARVDLSGVKAASALSLLGLADDVVSATLSSQPAGNFEIYVLVAEALLLKADAADILSAGTGSSARTEGRAMLDRAAFVQSPDAAELREALFKSRL